MARCACDGANRKAGARGRSTEDEDDDDDDDDDDDEAAAVDDEPMEIRAN